MFLKVKVILTKFIFIVKNQEVYRIDATISIDFYLI